jgi:DNA-binding NarL/FixJ family response regulator
MEEPLRVLVVDDHPVFRFGLRTLLAALSDVRVAGEAATGREAVEAAAGLQPDVVVMDLHLPELNGIEATRKIVETSPHIAVLVLTMFEDDESVFSAIRAGARGYLLKSAGQVEITRAVRAVGQGEAIFGPAVARRMIKFFANAPSEQAADALPELTGREREVLALIAAGESNAGIARRLVISAKTVRNHVSNIFSKLHVADRAQAIVRARQAGLGDSGPVEFGQQRAGSGRRRERSAEA